MREFENRKTPQGLLYRNVDHFVNADGKFLFCRYWSPQTAPRALLMLIHNAGDHSGRYTELVSLFLKKSMFVFSHDHIGHGQSEGDRLWVSDFRIYVRDCVQHLDMMKRQFPALRIYIFAVSMGALIATYVLYDRPLDIAGLIFIAPLVLMNPESATPGKMLFSKMVNYLLPHAPLGYIDPEATSRDETQVEKYINDPLNCHVAVRVRFAFEVLTALSKVEKVFPIITVPLLILHGEKDKLSDVRGSYIMYGKVASTDKTFKVFNDCFHELQNELPEVVAEVMLLIDDWLEARLPQ
ncbi:monoglyceride lipase-like [Hemiscyllium ocellatum]|uniref:monoglyceride lipase-like n=1 Tax=Hemiscyllium ocellatum TaxID=170820 RepID=UPI00296740A6|nr:monoglyceride lipase-like [Hemiscyllium ocellatum]